MPNSSGSNLALRQLMKSTQLVESLRIRKPSLISRMEKMKLRKKSVDTEIAIQLSRLKEKNISDDLLLEIAHGLHASVLTIMHAEEFLEKIADDLEKLPNQIMKAEGTLKDKRGRFDKCTILSVSTEEEVQWLVRNGVFRMLQVWGGLEDEDKVKLKKYAESRGFDVKKI